MEDKNLDLNIKLDFYKKTLLGITEYQYFALTKKTKYYFIILSLCYNFNSIALLNYNQNTVHRFFKIRRKK